jgi:hypothetical protein
MIHRGADGIAGDRDAFQELEAIAKVDYVEGRPDTVDDASLQPTVRRLLLISMLFWRH